jgi:hypothetical protein
MGGTLRGFAMGVVLWHPQRPTPFEDSGRATLPRDQPPEFFPSLRNFASRP